MVRRKCLCSPDKNIKIESNSKKKNYWFLCSEGGREEHGSIHILTKQIVKDKGVEASEGWYPKYKGVGAS